MISTRGWVLDVFDDRRDGVVLWLISRDGRRLRLHQPFPVTFYAAGASTRLRALWRWLRQQPEATRLERGTRHDLFKPQPVTVLEIQVDQTACQPGLFRRAAAEFPDLDYYNADVQLSLRYTAATGVFPMVYCSVEAHDDGTLKDIRPLETRWELDPEVTTLHVLHMEPDCDPSHAQPHLLSLRCDRFEYELSLDHPRPLLVNLRAIFRRHDPDVLLTTWGDTWLLPRLLELSEQTGLELPLNREPGRHLALRAERTYFSYGQIIYKGQQMHLYGRCHMDRRNAMLWGDYGLEGTIEAARVTALPLQTAARTSPGTGISSMETLTALQNDILVPWHKQQAERTKTALDLLRYDQGGMIYSPIAGLHANVGNIDFVSMYPSVMVKCNISPELPQPRELGVSPYPPGLVPQTLAPLLEKRIALKQRVGNAPPWDENLPRDKARSQAHKWLLVTCFGYLGYRNARFGRIESHEAVTTWGREALLRAKEAAEDMGFEVLHMYVDGLWVRREGCSQPQDFQPLLEEILNRTHLPVGLDGVYRWIAFLPSRVDSRVSVPNRYFGMFQDGSFKLRGIDLRRRDTPEFISDTQMALLHCLSQAGDAAALRGLKEEAVGVLRARLRLLRTGRVPLDKLLVAQKLSRELAAYRDPSPAARAAAQLEAIGKTVRPGQRVRFLLLRGKPGVHAWDLPQKPDPRTLDVARYATLTIRAASSIFQPLGMGEKELEQLATERLETPCFDFSSALQTM